MDAGNTATGRPRQPVPLLPRLLVAFTAAAIALEALFHAHRAGVAASTPVLATAAGEIVASYEPVRI
jgi:hypothetical protein